MSELVSPGKVADAEQLCVGRGHACSMEALLEEFPYKTWSRVSPRFLMMGRGGRELTFIAFHPGTLLGLIDEDDRLDAIVKEGADSARHPARGGHVGLAIVAVGLRGDLERSENVGRLIRIEFGSDVPLGKGLDGERARERRDDRRGGRTGGS
jgi:hypothetical protein